MSRKHQDLHRYRIDVSLNYDGSVWQALLYERVGNRFNEWQSLPVPLEYASALTKEEVLIEAEEKLNTYKAVVQEQEDRAARIRDSKETLYYS